MRYFLFIFLFTSIYVKAQKKGTSQLYLGTARQQYFDNGGVNNDNILPNDNIRPNNPFAQNYSIEYRRTTRSGWIYGGGLQTGMRKYDIGIYRNLSNFDPQAKESLAGAIYQRRIIANVRYFEPRIFTGYHYPLNAKWAVSVMAGMSFRFFTSGVEEYNRTKFISYKLDNSNITIETPFIQEDYDFGRSPLGYVGGKLFKRNYITEHAFNVDLYIGIQRKVNYKWLKTIEVGLEADHRIDNKSWKTLDNIPTSAMLVWLRPDISVTDENNFSKDQFYDRNISLGIRLSLGLWK